VGRVTKLGWVLVGSVVATVVLAVVWPAVALVAAIVLALAAATAVADGMAAPISWFDVDVASERKRDALTRRLKRGRPSGRPLRPTTPTRPRTSPGNASASGAA
jgi:hypothetical protein